MLFKTLDWNIALLFSNLGYEKERRLLINLLLKIDRGIRWDWSTLRQNLSHRLLIWTHFFFISTFLVSSLLSVKISVSWSLQKEGFFCSLHLVTFFDFTVYGSSMEVYAFHYFQAIFQYHLYEKIHSIVLLVSKKVFQYFFKIKMINFFSLSIYGNVKVMTVIQVLLCIL